MDSKEMISEAKLELENIDMVIDVKHNPVISAFISLMKEMPFIGDLIDDSLESVLSDFQSKKQQKLLEVIGQASLGTVTSDMVNDVEFIMGFAKTKNAVDKLSNGDKVKFYGNLLVNGYLNDKDKISVDEFDEYVELINSLSYRELEYLSFFKEHSDKHRGILIYQHWEEFSKEFENKFPKRDVYFVYKRLERTGFISEVTETESVEENTGSLDIDSIGYKTESELSRFNEMVLKNI